MKKMLIALALGAAAIAPAAGAMENMFGNTLVAAVTGGPEVRVHFNADNTYSMALPDGSAVQGAWAENNGQLCLTPQGGAAECYPELGERNVGETWTVSGPQGEMTLSLVAGR